MDIGVQVYTNTRDSSQKRVMISNETRRVGNEAGHQRSQPKNKLGTRRTLTRFETLVLGHMGAQSLIFSTKTKHSHWFEKSLKLRKDYPLMTM